MKKNKDVFEDAPDLSSDVLKPSVPSSTPLNDAELAAKPLKERKGLGAKIARHIDEENEGFSDDKNEKDSESLGR